ncbi:NAD(P)-binding domain-containing protein [Dictyobacter formicarum]|uniref:Flavoprotein n=1 Tax=Dictyobacter formicarum TaxID=2778368 RepID=A0ABQ3VUX9_9CHLR|nr:NAD(P)-binding domain-containing protein [Dictyobacter formicarum]GHO89795.1 flavoprotein [Dictyobacter formicarum]
MQKQTLPVVIIGAGPVGLAAAAHVIRKGETPLLFEAGSTVGASMLQWGQVRLFSPWRYLVDQQAQALLEAQGWQAPDPDTYPTAREVVERYLFPLAQVPQVLAALQLQTRVTAISRLSMDKVKTPLRDETPFVVRIQSGNSEEHDILARAVIDASGTYQTPNPLGAHGLFALGERSLGDHIFYGIPDILGTERGRYAGRRVLVVGSGHSAQQTLLELAQLSEQEPTTQVLWAIRRPAVGQLFGGGEEDELPERGQLGLRSLALVEQGKVRLFAGVQIHAVTRTAQGIAIVGEEERIGPVDEIIATTGFRPDLSWLRELRLALDPALESPTGLAPLIDPNVHSCGTVPPHGVDELAHPESNFFIVGMKSYGRAPTFLMLTGYEQVRSIVAALSGDWEAARNVELVLPETGVCSADGGSCCTPAASPLLTIGVTRRRASTGRS